MQAKIQKWGNSLALRIPKAFAEEVGLSEDSAVEIRLVEGKLVIEASSEDDETLEEMLARVTDENIHGLIDRGPAVGREIWWEE
jgi:antitoxin MazE